MQLQWQEVDRDGIKVCENSTADRFDGHTKANRERQFHDLAPFADFECYLLLCNYECGSVVVDFEFEININCAIFLGGSFKRASKFIGTFLYQFTDSGFAFRIGGKIVN